MAHYVAYQSCARAGLAQTKVGHGPGLKVNGPGHRAASCLVGLKPSFLIFFIQDA